jgi:DNA-binding CsgD family transcriptional regulator
MVGVGMPGGSTAALARRYVEPTQPPVLQLWRATAASEAMWSNGPAARALTMLRPVLEQDLLAAETGSVLQTMTTLVLIVSDELDTAIARCSWLVDLARPRGWTIALAHGCMFRAAALVRTGRISDADADARLAFDSKLPVAPREAMLWSLAFLLDALVEADDLVGAEQALVAAGQQGEPPPGPLAAVLMLRSRAHLRLAQHRPRQALEDALAGRTRAEELDLRHAILAGWRTEAVEALMLLGQSRDASRLAYEQAELAEQLGTVSALAGALRLQARVEPDPLPLLRRSVEMLAESPARLEYVRSLVDLGTALRRANRRAEAREPLSTALELAERDGMRLLARHARTELLSTGARPRRSALSGPAALTPAERRIAVMAAQGQSNRAIAERLYVTQRTVETHLTHTFSKLHIATRTELASVLDTAHGTPNARRSR